MAYPATIDIFTGQSDYKDRIYASHINEIHESIGNIETELGTDPAGSAATLKDRLANALPVNVKDYGAIGDSVTDCTTFINNAIAALSAKGGIVFFPAGSYIISSPLVLPANKPVYLVGVGMGSSSAQASELKLKSNSNCNMIEYTSATRTFFGGIIDMTLHGNATNQTSGSIVSITGWWTDVIFEKVFFTAGKDAELYIKPPAVSGLGNWWINKCLFETSGDAATGYGIQVDAANNIFGQVWLTDTYFYDVKEGLHWDGSAVDTGVALARISGCEFVHTKEHAIYLKSVQWVNIENTIIRNSGRSIANTYDGIVLDATVTRPSQEIILSGNQISNISWASASQRYGINLAHSNIDYCLIEDNIILGNATSAINVTPGANANGFIRNNIGFLSEKWGNASVADGGTIAHGLATTPTSVRLTPSGAGHIATATVDASNITVGLKDHDGSAVGVAETVYWEARS